MTPETLVYQFRKHFPQMPRIALLGIRGFLNPENKMDVYDDVIIRFIDGTISAFRASVDPGSYYLQNPVNEHGCARLQCGLWWYTRGEHHAKPAFVQLEEVTVDRLDPRGNKRMQDSGFFGVNIHSGGPEYLVGRYSAGCQVIWSEEPWKAQWLDFYVPLIGAMVDMGVSRIPYLLVDKLEAEPVIE